MEHEREHERHRHHSPGGDDPDPETLNRTREELEGIYQAADQAMDAMLHSNNELVLQQSRQEGAQ